MNTYMHNWNNYQKINCEWVSSHATMHSLTEMHAWSGSTLSVCMSPLLYPPRHTHKPSFLKGFTVHSGGSETTGHVKMQMIKTEESGNVIRYIKKHLRLKNQSRRLELGTSQPLTRKLPLWAELNRTRERETPRPNSNYSLYPQTGVFENQS